MKEYKDSLSGTNLIKTRSSKIDIVKIMNKTSSRTKIQWIAILQGWAMLWVVIGHARFLKSDGGGYPIIEALIDIAYSFHMPLFMFVSGGLLYITKISKNTKYRLVLLSRLKRLGIPFLTFTYLAYFLKYFASAYMKRDISLSAASFFEALVDPRNGPLLEMWFIISLLCITLLYNVFRWADKSIYTEGLILSSTLLIYFLFNTDITYFALKDTAKLLCFFYMGILSFKYDLANKLNSLIVVSMALLVYVILFYLDYSKFLLICSGIFLSLSLSKYVSAFLPELFSTFRNYTYQIFLMGIFFQVLVSQILWRIIPQVEYFIIPMYLINIVGGLYIPVLISYAVKSLRNKYLNMIFGL